MSKPQTNPEKTLHLHKTREAAGRDGVLYRTYELLDWLKERDISPELGDAFLGSWVALLRQQILDRAERDEGFFEGDRRKEISLRLGPDLTPEGWEPNEVHSQIEKELFSETDPDQSHYLLGFLVSSIEEKLNELDGRKAFEPVGWIKPMRTEGSPTRGFTIYFWQDFLNPIVEVPDELIVGSGTPLSARSRNATLPESYIVRPHLESYLRSIWRRFPGVGEGQKDFNKS